MFGRWTGLLAMVGGMLVISGSLATSLAAQVGDGFLFNEPRFGLSVRVGYDAPFGPRSTGGDTDIFEFTQSRLTIDEADHDALQVGGELAVRVSSRMDFVFDVSFARSDVLSEFRDFVEEVGGAEIPIEQVTEFTRVPVNFSLRYFLAERGTRVSRFAWVPNDWVPYLGGGFGITRYEFLQDGDFVDEDTFEIFGSRLRSSGHAVTGHALAGITHTLAPNVVLSGEARYRIGSAELTRDFVGFDDIDLSGLQLTLGLGVRF